jgi:hypothetical protein
MVNMIASHCTRGSSAGTKWLPQVREVKEDAVSVARLRSCGMIIIGKAVMHELGMGTTGNNPHHGYLFMFFSLGPTYILLVLLFITLLIVNFVSSFTCRDTVRSLKLIYSSGIVHLKF